MTTTRCGAVLPTTRSAGGGAASCVGPRLSVSIVGDAARSGSRSDPITAARGDRLAVTGTFYLADCHDAVSDGGSPGPDPVIASVPLRLLAAGRAFPLPTGHPDRRGAFTVDATMPAGVTAGPATIEDSLGHAVDVVAQ